MKAKDRLTAVLCANAIGSFQLEADRKKELRARPLWTQVSEQTAQVDEIAVACGVERAQKGIRMVKITSLRPHAEKPRKQADIRVFLSSDN